MASPFSTLFKLKIASPQLKTLISASAPPFTRVMGGRQFTPSIIVFLVWRALLARK